MSEDVEEFVDRLRSDPEAFRRRRAEAERIIAEILRDPPRSVSISVEVELDETIAPAYAVSKAIFESVTDRDESEFVRYLLCQGVGEELNRLASVRNRIMRMGSVESVADGYGLDLRDEDRRIASAETDVVAGGDRSLTDYHRRGYVSTRCPRCRRRAVWHPVRYDLSCIDGCGPIGKFETRPGPDGSKDV